MTFNNLSDDDLKLMNVLMNAFCYECKSAIDFKGSLAFDKEYLENIVRKINFAASLCFKSKEKLEDADLVCDLIHVQWWAFAFDSRHLFTLNQEDVRVVIIALEEACQIFDGDVDVIIGSYDDLETLKYKLEVLLSDMAFDTVSDNDLSIVNTALYEFSYELSNIDFQLLFSFKKDFLERIVCKIKVILNNRSFLQKWGAYHPKQPFSLYPGEIKVVIQALEKISISIDDVDFAIKIGCSLDEIKAIKNRLEFVLTEMTFYTLSDKDLSIIKNLINGYFHALRAIYLFVIFSYDKEFLENLLCKIEAIVKNRMYLQKWGTFDPTKPFNLSLIEMKLLIQALEKKDKYFKEEDIPAKFGCSLGELVELKSKLELLVSKQNI